MKRPDTDMTFLLPVWNTYMMQQSSCNDKVTSQDVLRGSDTESPRFLVTLGTSPSYELPASALCSQDSIA